MNLQDYARYAQQSADELARDCEEVRLSNLENGKHLSDFDAPVWVKPSAGAYVAYSHGLTSLM